MLRRGVGVFEIGRAVHAKQELELPQSQIAIMFTECNLVKASVGAAADGVLFDVAWLPNASFVLVAAVIVLGAILSVRLLKVLDAREPADGRTGDYRGMTRHAWPPFMRRSWQKNPSGRFPQHI